MRELLDDGELGQVLGASATVMWHRTADYYREPALARHLG